MLFEEMNGTLSWIFYKDLQTVYGLPLNVYKHASMMLNEPIPGGDCEVLAEYLGYSAKNNPDSNSRRILQTPFCFIGLANPEIA